MRPHMACLVKIQGRQGCSDDAGSCDRPGAGRSIAFAIYLARHILHYQLSFARFDTRPDRVSYNSYSVQPAYLSGLDKRCDLLYQHIQTPWQYNASPERAGEQDHSF